MREYKSMKRMSKRQTITCSGSNKTSQLWTYDPQGDFLYWYLSHFFLFLYLK